MQLRQLAASGLALLLSRLVEQGEAQACPQLLEELRAWVAGSTGGTGSTEAAAGEASGSGHSNTWGVALMRALSGDHAALDAAEAARDKRGGGLASLQVGEGQGTYPGWSL